MLLLRPRKGHGDATVPFPPALRGGDMELNPVTPKRISLAGTVGGCGRAPPPAGTGCCWG